MRSNFFLNICVLLTLLTTGGFIAVAQTSDSTSEEISSLTQTINQKKENIDGINRRIDTYKKKIQEKEKEKISLEGELSLLDNRIAKTDLEIQEVEEVIDLINTELALLTQQISDIEKKLQGDRELMAGVLRQLQLKDQDLPLHVFFGAESMSSLFDEMQALATVNQDLKRTLDNAKQLKQEAQDKQLKQKSKRDQMEQLEETLTQEKTQLTEEVLAREQLITQTQRSENSFRALLQDLKQEQSTINQQIATLQKEVEAKLQGHDGVGDSAVLSWPLNQTLKGISAEFHDPSYPYRHLFEHSGIDLPASKGTAVRAAAPGYVAWARTGRLYGNYVMIIHANGVATLYAHLSRINVKVDDFVTNESVIGAVGSTGLSTGPHLHFEVRKNGVPTNPRDYLPN